MISIESNINEVRLRVSKRVKNLVDTDQMLREMATTVAGKVHARVHNDGLDSNNQPIGEYPDSYMKIRTSKKYNRLQDRRVILSLTREMENDLVIISEGNPIKIENGYAIGYFKDINYQKSQWTQDHYGKPIWKTTNQEREVVKGIAEQHIERAKNV